LKLCCLVLKTCAAATKRKSNEACLLLHKPNSFLFHFFANSLKMDPRRIVRALVVMAKACHVTSILECSRRFGANKAIKMVEGIIVEVIPTTNSTSNRTTTAVVADYQHGGGATKRASLHIRSIKPVT
jgi:hypothetical protein